jgi:hypothetical protein
MQIVKYTEIRKVTPDASTTIWEYDTTDPTISGAVAQINGRYPKKGFAENGFKELVFVISGNGFLVTPEERKEIDLGDEILIDKNEKYAWEGNMTLFMATTPKFDLKQHKITGK